MQLLWIEGRVSRTNQDAPPGQQPPEEVSHPRSKEPPLGDLTQLIPDFAPYPYIQNPESPSRIRNLKPLTLTLNPEPQTPNPKP